MGSPYTVQEETHIETPYLSDPYSRIQSCLFFCLTEGVLSGCSSAACIHSATQSHSGVHFRQLKVLGRARGRQSPSCALNTNAENFVSVLKLSFNHSYVKTLGRWIRTAEKLITASRCIFSLCCSHRQADMAPYWNTSISWYMYQKRIDRMADFVPFLFCHMLLLWTTCH